MNWNAIVILSIMILAGVVIAVSDMLTRKRRRNRCSMSIVAECVDIARLYDEADPLFAPIWKYTVDGAEYTVQETAYTNRKIEVGAMKDIYVNPDNPREIFRENKSAAVGSAVVGFGIAVISAVAMIITIVISVKG